MNVDSLKELGFKKAAWLTLTADLKVEPVFLPQADIDTPGVYFWVQLYPNDTSEIVYIGLYGQTVRKRFKEHLGGFKHSQSGRLKGKYLTSCLQSNSYFEIYSKPSHSQVITYKSVLGEQVGTVISTNAQDEIDMLAAFYKEHGRKPVLNKTKGG